MHASAKLNAKRFFDSYGPYFPDGAVVLDIGSMDVNGSLKEVCPTRFQYVGIDFEAGKNVDYVMKDPYKVPAFDKSVDIVISSSTFEHSEMFWLLFLDVMRTLQPNGLFYLNVPSNGAFHRHPVDCWRFYPDAAGALVTWAKRNNMNSAYIESFWSDTGDDGSTWNDYVAVFIKDVLNINTYPERMVYERDSNGKVAKFKVDEGGITNGLFYDLGPLHIVDMRDLPDGTNLDGTTTLKDVPGKYRK